MFLMIINRTSFRMIDNALYDKTEGPVVFFINIKHIYSPHQYTFLLKTIYLHAKSFQKELYCFKGTHESFIRALKEDARLSGTIYIDETDDPKQWGEFDSALAKSFDLKRVSTLTLIDWKLHSVKKIFENTYYPQVISFKRFLDPILDLEKSIKLYSNISCYKDAVSKYYNKPQCPTFKKKNKGWMTYAGLEKHITETSSGSSDRTNSSTLDFPLIKSNEDLDTQVAHYFDKTLEDLRSDSWYKPHTCADIALTDTKTKGDQNTSRCSPLFALGILSPSLAYFLWSGSTYRIPSDSKIGSATDQLIWREFFHACCYLKGYWSPTSIGIRSFKWKKNKEGLEKWKSGQTGRHDVDVAMKSLTQSGWIHHLQRHVVADYLTRGHLQIDWKKGEDWFRKTLIDHDAAVNRANWLGLSASAFSSKQKVYHYNYDNYIQRHCNKQTRKKGNNTKKHVKTIKKLLL